jgi:protease-4
MKFLRNLLASILGGLISIGVVFMVLVIVVMAIEKSEKIVVENNSVLEIDLGTAVKDYAPKSENPLDEVLGLEEEKLGLDQILNAIENAADDENIAGISITSNGVYAGIAQTQAIRNKLASFKESGKFIHAYADYFTQKSYYLGCIADSIYLNPQGMVDFKGLSSEVLFLKDLEDKTGIKMEVIRHGKYKSAVEPFLYNEMSVENREQITSFLKSIWQAMLEDVSESRDIAVEELNNIADNLLGRNPALALENNLIDNVVYADQYTDKLKAAVGISEDDSLNKISISDYISTGAGRLKSTGSDRIAVIYAQGEIIYGKGDEDYVGNELLIKALKKARNTKSVKAVVLRVNSPGGSALATELIWRELELTMDKLPLVVSMGNLATSGGYYMASGADRIFAEPTTITGSIGVFGVVPNISQFADDIGVNAEQVATNSGPDYSLFEPMSDAFRNVAIEGVEEVYNLFLKRVSEGRGMTMEEADAVGQGRVWSGNEALKNGLIDEIGSLADAVDHAAELAEITDYRIRSYPSYKKDLKDQLSGNPFLKTKVEFLKEELGEEQYRIYKSIRDLSKLEGVQARIPYNLIIK